MADDTTVSAPDCKLSESKEKHQEHLELAGVVKGVHAHLRRKFWENGDFHKVWDEHCQDQTILSSYANAMHHLAVDHWNQRPETRIHWCRESCHEYFLRDGLAKALAKEERRKAHDTKRSSESSQVEEGSLSDDMLDLDAQNTYEGSPENPPYILLQSDLSDEMILPSSPPDRFPHFSARPVPVKSDTLTLNVESCRVPLPNQKVGNNNLTPQSPITSPLSGSPGFRPPQSAQKNPLEKCNDFMINMDLHSPSSQKDGSELADGEEDIALQKEAIYAKYGPVEYNSIALPFQGRIRLLDVGSCFNPFLEFEEFVSVGIDISPAVESVFHCDFLHLETPEPLQLARDTIDTILNTLQSPVTRLPRDSFHVVVFSLLLEYFPCQYQRWVCCQKAHSLLMINGLLLIITPDSQHQNKNAAMMKSWKQAIESMGFKRWKYVKQQHLHCMAFRKVSNEPENILIGETGPDMMFIPQDFNDCSLDSTENVSMFSSILRTNEEDSFIRDTFTELPDLAD